MTRAPEIPRLDIHRPIGRTGVGTAYEATETYGARDVVVEVATELEDGAARARFLRDAMIAQRLEGEHVLRVLDVGTLADGTPYLVREPVLASLATEIRTRGPISADQAVAWTLQACEAIAEGHALGMAHGDVRPDNVFVARGERDKAGELTMKVRWTSAAKAERAVTEDCHQDIAGLGDVLRALLSGQVDLSDEDRARTLPTPLAHIITSTLAARGAPKLRNVSELANALAPFAPASPSPRNVAFLLSRAGVAAAPPPSSRAPRTTTPEPRPDPGRPSDAWFAAVQRGSRTSFAPADAELYARPERRGKAFAAVAVALVALVAIGSFALYRAQKLPAWTGAADPADLYGTTTLTSAEIAKQGTSVDLASDATESGMKARATPIVANLVALKPLATNAGPARAATPGTPATPATLAPPERPATPATLAPPERPATPAEPAPAPAPAPVRTPVRTPPPARTDDGPRLPVPPPRVEEPRSDEPREREQPMTPPSKASPKDEPNPSPPVGEPAPPTKPETPDPGL